MKIFTTIAHCLEQIKFFRKALSVTWFWFIFKVGFWFMGLEEPSTQHTAFVSTVAGVTPAIIAAYSFSPKHKGEQL